MSGLGTPGAAGRILAVDDSAPFVELLATDLEGEGHTVTMACSGRECLEIAPKLRPEIILLDVNMPGMDGFETCFALKRDPLTENIPVIFLTGHNAAEGSAMAAILAGGSDFIEKPYSRSILLSRVAAHVAAKRRFDVVSASPLRVAGTELYSLIGVEDALMRYLALCHRLGRSCDVTLVAGKLTTSPEDWDFAEHLISLSASLLDGVAAPDMAFRADGSVMGALMFDADAVTIETLQKVLAAAGRLVATQSGVKDLSAALRSAF